MAIDIFKEQVLSLGAATRKLPTVRNGKGVNPSTLCRWALAGKKRPDGCVVRLEIIKIDGSTYTSLEALQRFFDRITGDESVVSPPIRQADVKLERAGT